MNASLKALLVPSCMVLLAGCAAEPVEEGPVGAARSAVMADNAIVPNAIVPNAIVPNAIVPNAIVPNALAPSAIAAIEDPGEAGVLSRLWIKYAVGCALTGASSFDFGRTDAGGVTHEESYPGILGLAPEWGTGPLGAAHQQLISACMAARTNYFGTTVAFSMRGPAPPISSPSTPELEAYPDVEGAFWGNIFASTPYLRACNVGANVANDRAYLRDCAAGYLGGSGTVDCGIIDILGDCGAICSALDAAGQYYPGCTDPLYGATTNVITTALPGGAVAGATANLQIEDSAPASFTLGACGTLAHTITVTSTGSTTAAAPTVIDALPVGLVFSSATSTSGSCSDAGSIVTCTLPDLAAGASAIITVNTVPTVWGTTVVDEAIGATASAEISVAANTALAGTSLVAPTPASWEPVALKFNGTPIPQGDTIWFTSVTKVQGLPNSGTTTLWAIGSTISFNAGGVGYSIAVPNARVTFNPSVTMGSTSYDVVHSEWITSLPTSFAGNNFMAAVPFPVPAALPGGIRDVVWSAHFVTNVSGVTVTPMAGAAVYTSFTSDLTAVDVQPSDDNHYSPYGTSDNAGTPEAFKAYVTGGNQGGGGSKYTGGLTQSSQGTPELQASCQ